MRVKDQNATLITKKMGLKEKRALTKLHDVAYYIALKDFNPQILKIS